MSMPIFNSENGIIIENPNLNIGDHSVYFDNLNDKSNIIEKYKK